MRPVRLLPMGESALLVETAGTHAVLALHTVLADLVERGEGVFAAVEDLVPAARTVLVVTRPGTDLAALATAVRGAAGRMGAAPADGGTEVVELAVRYDGPDLAEVARLTGLGKEEVVAAHTGTPWRVGFGGFAPGFAYLVGGDPRLAVPRHRSPRTRVPAGAVGLAGEFSGVYPRPSPGGWQLIGTTRVTLWDAGRHPPALLRPGLTVQFVPVS